MTDYQILDRIVRVPTEVENERVLKRNTQDLIDRIGPTFDSWYSSQGDCMNAYRNAGVIVGDTMGPLIDQAVAMLSTQGVYTIDATRFIDKYLGTYTDEFSKAMDNMMSAYVAAENQLEAEKRYREVRKANRGRVVGGGFGLGGALKGMATAGAMNAATGMAHSLGNAVGNLGSSMAAGSKKMEIYRNAREPLRKALINAGYELRRGLRKALQDETALKFKYVTTEESGKADAILKSYTQGRIPSEERTNQLITVLSLDPYKDKAYEIIWNDFGDKNGDLRKMASYFGCHLEKKISKAAAQYGEDVFKEKCSDYADAFDKEKAAVCTEKQIQEALEKMKLYCENHDIEEDLIPKISLCREILTTADAQNRTVKNVLYPSREIADYVRKDYERFYKYCEGKDLATDEQCKKICQQEYVSEEFKELVQSLCEKERILRNPEKIRDNLVNTFKEKLDEQVLITIGVNVVERFGVFSQHEPIVRTITGMPIDEIPLFSIERSSNGKSGIMVTDKSLRIYEKGLFASDNREIDLKKVIGCECVASGQFAFRTKDSDGIEVRIKPKEATDEQQIMLASAVEQAIALINNLTPQSSSNLYRTLYGKITCRCGTKLLSNEKVCPICGRMMKSNGEMVETICCPSCGSPQPKDKNFCSNCGTSLIENSNNISNDSHKGVPEIAPIEDTSDRKQVGEMKTETKTQEEITSESRFCPNCGKQINQGKKFCAACGTKL